MPALLIGMLCSAFLASGGHLTSYLSFTRDVASWQFWYYGVNDIDKTYSLAQLLSWKDHHRTLLHWLVYLAAMGWCLCKLCRKQENDRTILFVFLFTSVLAGQAVYILGSGGDNFTEGLYDLVIILFWALVCRGALWLARRANALPALRCAAVALMLCYGAYTLYLDAAQAKAVRAARGPNAENYVEQLEGVTKDAAALKEMAAIVGDEPLFATYATALDDMRGTFQPTGSDYIIHALGDRRFADYVANFTAQNYPWVQTTNYNIWGWEPWAAAASWDFYRELYASYTVHSDHGYWTLWEYAGKNANLLDAPVTLSVELLSEHETVLRVQSTETRPCYVDVVVSWDNAYEANAYRLQTWNSSVFVYDPAQRTARKGVGDGYFRPAQGEEQHLMVYMENGEGFIRLSGQPMECTRLNVSDARVGEVILFQR